MADRQSNSRDAPARPDFGRYSGIRRTPGERKVVTVLFADIVESSAMVSGRDPEEADQALLAILHILTHSVSRYGGTVAQMLGDGMMAVFGAPTALEDHALRACLAAQDIARAASDSGDFKVRVGISSGEVLAQVVESGVWSDYRTVGETVHAAAKLQQRADPNGVLLSRETRDLVPAGLSVRPAGVLRLAKGAEPLAVFALESVRAIRRTAMDLLSSDTSLFVGRRSEMAALTEALRQAAAGTGSVVLLSGEAGIGKSRLTGELTRHEEAAGFGVLQWPQFPIRRLGEPDDLEAAAVSLAQLVAGAAGVPAAGQGAALVVAAAGRGAGELAGEAVRELLGTPSPCPLWQGLDAAQRVDFAIDGLVAAVLDLAGARPLLILVEDAHWTHGLTTRLLDSLAAVVEDAPVLVLVTARPDSAAGWTAPDTVRRIAIEPLEAIQIDEFLDHWLGRHPSLADLKARVAAQSQGVPLYLEESLRALESAGVVVGSPGQYQLGDRDDRMLLPATVHGLLAARIDTLPEPARRTLMHAAVIGGAVDLDLLRQIAPVPSAELPAVLARLEQEGYLARSRLLPNLEVTFRHALVQEVAYATLTRRERQPLHGHILRALRRRREEDLPGRTELMAHHAFFAEDWASACVYGRRAGRRAEERCRHADSGRYYGNALKALDHLPETRRNGLRRIDLWIAIPRILLPQGGRGADNLLEKARSLALRLDDRIGHARATSMLASVHWAYGDLDTGIALSRDALRTAESRHQRTTLVQLLIRLGGMLTEKGAFREAADTVGEAIHLVADDRSFGRYGLTLAAIVAARGHLARAQAELGRQPEAVATAVAAFEAAEESGHAFSKVVASLYLGLVHILGGSHEQAIPFLKTAMTLAEAMRAHVYQPWTLGALGYALARTGSMTEGAALLTASREHGRMIGVTRHEAQTLNWLSDVTLMAGDPNGAMRCAEEACRLARESGQEAVEAWGLLALGRAQEAAARPAEAARSFASAEALGLRLSMGPLLAQCRRATAAAHS